MYERAYLEMDIVMLTQHDLLQSQSVLTLPMTRDENMYVRHIMSSFFNDI